MSAGFEDLFDSYVFKSFDKHCINQVSSESRTNRLLYVCLCIHTCICKRETDWLQGIGCIVVEADFKAGWRPREADVVVQI